MTIKIYVDWDNQEIRQESDKKEWIAEYVENRLSSDYDLEDFLDDLFNNTEHCRCPMAYLLKATEGAKEEIIDKFEKRAYEDAEEAFYDNHEEIEIEI